MSLALNILLFSLLGCVVAILLGIVFALLKKKVDKEEDDCEIAAGILQEHILWPEAAAAVRKFGRFNIVGGLRAIKVAVAMYAGQKIWVLLTKITCKCIPAILRDTNHDGGKAQRLQVATTIVGELPRLMDDADTATLFDDAIFTQATGLALDAQGKANLVLISMGLGDFGLDNLKMLCMDLASDQPKAARPIVQAIALELSTEDGRVATAKKVLAKLVPHLLSDKDNAAWLKGLVNGTPPTP